MNMIVEDTGLKNTKTISDEKVKQVLLHEKPLTFKAKANESKVVLDNFVGIRELPDLDMHSKAGIVFYNLLQCFMLNNNVEESSIKNVMAGFAVSGVDPATTMDGFIELYSLGYIDFVDSNGVKLLGTVNEYSWYKLRPKFTDLFARNSGQAMRSPNDPKQSPIPSRRKFTGAQLFIDELTSKLKDDKQLNSLTDKELKI